MSPTADRLRDPQQRQERATRVLDVAAALLLRHGYRRVTVDDVATGADTMPTCSGVAGSVLGARA
jgi:AcrR family transcriptional regulator